MQREDRSGRGLFLSLPRSCHFRIPLAFRELLFLLQSLPASPWFGVLSDPLYTDFGELSTGRLIDGSTAFRRWWTCPGSVSPSPHKATVHSGAAGGPKDKRWRARRPVWGAERAETEGALPLLRTSAHREASLGLTSTANQNRDRVRMKTPSHSTPCLHPPFRVFWRATLSWVVYCSGALDLFLRKSEGNWVSVFTTRPPAEVCAVPSTS